MCIFELWKYSNHRLWIGQVDGDINLGGSTFFLLYLSRCASDNVAFCSKGLRHMVPNVRAETEKKHNWGFCCHVWIEVFEVHKEFEMRWWCLKTKPYVSGPIYTFLSRKHAVALSFSTWVVWLSPLLTSTVVRSNLPERSLRTLRFNSSLVSNSSFHLRLQDRGISLTN